MGRQPLPDARRPPRARDRRPLDGRLRHLHLRRPPPRPVHRRAEPVRAPSTPPRRPGSARRDRLDVGRDGGPPGSLWGPFATQEVRWRAHDPYDLAENLRGLALWLRTGNGQPGGPFGGGPNVDVIEAGVVRDGRRTSTSACSTSASRTSTTTTAPASTSGPTGIAGSSETLPAIMKRFHRGSKPPARVTFSAAEPTLLGLRVEREGQAPGDGVQPPGQRRPARLHAVRQR